MGTFTGAGGGLGSHAAEAWPAPVSLLWLCPLLTLRFGYRVLASEVSFVLAI